MNKVRAALVVGLAMAAVAGWAQTATPAAKPVDEWRNAYEKQLREDFPWLKHFEAQNSKLAAPVAGTPRVVLMGDSITQGWEEHGLPANPVDPKHDWVNRGISGQTTPQMVLRMHQDVIALKADVVVILAGTNDIAGNTGEATVGQIEDNLAAMAEIASANGVKVVLCSVLPAFDYPWKPGREPAPKIIAINKWMKAYAEARGYVYVDYWTAMADERGGLPKKLSGDGVHPNGDGYAIMLPLAEAGVAKALGK